MKEGKASWTAKGTAFYRAVESALPEGERACCDPLAGEFLRADVRLLCRNRTAARTARLLILRGPLAPSYHYIVSRTAYIDGCLEESIADGIEQLVILGAGFDSRAYRFRELKDRVRVFEVDHPATQRLKVRRVGKMLGSLPGNVVYVPIDFEGGELEERLLWGGYNPGLKTLFIWEGVVSYLTPEAVDGTLSVVARNSGEGSSIVFTCTFRSVVEGASRGAGRDYRAYIQRKGERHIFGLDEDEIEGFLSARGFALLEHLTSEELEEAYIKRRDRAGKAPGHSAVVRATIRAG